MAPQIDLIVIGEPVPVMIGMRQGEGPAVVIILFSGRVLHEADQVFGRLPERFLFLFAIRHLEPEQVFPHFLPADFSPGEQQQGALNDVAQFAHVSGPVIAAHLGNGGIINLWRLDLNAYRQALGNGINEHRDIDRPFRQARYPHRKYVDPKEQVSPEISLLDLRFDILVGCTDQPEIDRDFLAAADPLDCAFFKGAEQF